MLTCDYKYNGHKFNPLPGYRMVFWQRAFTYIAQSSRLDRTVQLVVVTGTGCFERYVYLVLVKRRFALLPWKNIRSVYGPVLWLDQCWKDWKPKHLYQHQQQKSSWRKLYMDSNIEYILNVYNSCFLFAMVCKFHFVIYTLITEWYSICIDTCTNLLIVYFVVNQVLNENPGY